jgi:NAD-dependent deacetylase
MKDDLSLAAEKIRKSPFTLAFTGAGISVESGIPPFRGEKGLWNKYNPEILEINYFYDHGEKSWEVIREIFYDFFGLASPNPGHYALAKMEELGYLHAIVTQNIDNLHQMAGSKNIAEFHGNSSRLICPDCNTIYPAAETDLTKLPPRCQHDQHILKPDFVFFGEGIPADAWERSFDYAGLCSVCLIIGSTGEVVPASYVPQKASQNGAFIIEINPEESQFTHSITNLHLKGKAGEILPKLLEKLREN